MLISSCVVDLTPRTALAMGGYQGEPRLAVATDGSLEANVVAFGTGPDAIVLVSVDTLFAGARLTQAICDTCLEVFGIGPDRVLVLASHTHSAPMLDLAKPRLGVADRIEVERCAELIGAGIRAMVPEPVGTASCANGASDQSINRRRRWPWPTLVRLLGKAHGQIVMADNPDGPRDPWIRTCIWQSPDGKPLAAFWSFACHPVFYPGQDRASPDFVGTVREGLRQTFGASLPVIFGPGCMGDVWPRMATGRTSQLRRLVDVVVFGPKAPTVDMDSWSTWAQALAARVGEIAVSGSRVQIGNALPSTAMAAVPLDELFDGTSPTTEFVAKSVSVPGLGRIISLSCEPVSEVAGLIAADPDRLVLGYEGDVFGYLPTDAMVAEGGYEAERFVPIFGMAGRFRPGLDDRLKRLGAQLRS